MPITGPSEGREHLAEIDPPGKLAREPAPEGPSIRRPQPVEGAVHQDDVSESEAGKEQKNDSIEADASQVAKRDGQRKSQQRDERDEIAARWTPEAAPVFERGDQYEGRQHDD